MRIAATMTEKRLRSLTKSTACGVVPGFWVSVKKLKDGSYRKYFVLRERTIGRFFTLDAYPELSLAEAFKKAIVWKDKIAQGAAKGAVTVAGSAIDAGTISLYVVGTRPQIGATVGQTAAETAKAIAAAVNEAAELPVTAEASEGVVTLTA